MGKTFKIRKHSSSSKHKRLGSGKGFNPEKRSDKFRFDPRDYRGPREEED